MLRNFFSSITTKLTLILLAMGAMTGAAIFIAYLVFQSVGANLHLLTTQNVPQLHDTTQVILEAGHLKDGFAGLLLAETETELRENETRMNENLERAKEAILLLTGSAQEEQISSLSTVRESFVALVEARSTEFKNVAAIQKSIQRLRALSEAVSSQIYTLTDDAFFNLNIGSEDTIQAVDDTLSILVDENFAALQITLQIRAEVNLLSGVALAKSETKDSALNAILGDLGQGAVSRLSNLMSQADEHDLTKSYLPALTEALTFFQEINKPGYYFDTKVRERILSVRQSSDVLLTTAVDDFVFSISIDVADASEKNGVAITALLDGEVTRIRELATLSSSVDSVIALSLTGATAPDDASMMIVQEQLAGAAEKLTGMSAIGGADLEVFVVQIAAVADPEKGMIALHRSAFQARTRAAEISHQAAKDIHAISEHATSYGEAALGEITESGLTLVAEIAQANTNLKYIAISSLALFFLTQLITYWSIIRPMGLVTRRTETLAGGDLQLAPELNKYRGEIGRLAQALAVFREGLAKKLQLEKEEKRQQRQRQEDAAKAELDKQALEQREREILKEAERKQREAEEAQRQEREELHKAAEKEQQARIAEQDLVVSALAKGLKKLADGNLDAAIEDEFAKGYEQLRLDFNEAIETLDQVILRISDSSGAISTESTSLSHASDELAKRTERSASTLEETAAALKQLTISVESAADGASQANQVVSIAKDNALKSEEVVRETVLAMGEIEASSMKITKITSVIDDIAFQTNLLALNAGVEAARAGESGRGFAVVASEVRALAQRSSEAAQQISELILHSGNQVKTGVGLVDQTGEALKEIISSVGGISSHVSKIAKSSKEQSTGLSEINNAMSQLDQVTQQNAAMFEETTAANHALARETQVLAEAVGIFSPTVADDNVLTYPTDEHLPAVDGPEARERKI